MKPPRQGDPRELAAALRAAATSFATAAHALAAMLEHAAALTEHATAVLTAPAGMSGPTNDEHAGDLRTVKEFCRDNKLSTSYYYKLKARGDGPRETRVGHKVLISRKAARSWRKQHEQQR